MKIVDSLPCRVCTIDNTWIPMRDGTRLAAKLWLPEEAEVRPVPAIVEYIPYRKRDGTAVRDSMMHPYLAGHGYACLRVDIRGSGDSEGVLQDEYLNQELHDGEDVLAWAASHSWCTGETGMIGISWGGFNGLQIAARRPPSLGAVVSLCSTDDRYADDVHYMGGCLLGDNLSWASTMFAYNSSPPDPAVAGEKWRDLWIQRLEGSGLWLEKWLEHQRRDAYWKHGSVCEDISAIRCPVMAASGWADAYTNAVFRLLERLEVPRLGIVGPWGHKYPHIGVPGPAVGFLQEVIRWFDHWLKQQPTGIMDEPMLRAWMEDSMPPATGYAERPGRWVAEPAWPSPRIKPDRWYLTPDGLTNAPGRRVGINVQSPLTLGQFGGKWCSENAPPDLPGDQREEDGGALIFDSQPLEQTVEFLGAPLMEFEVAADHPVAMIAVRLSDVRPDGKIARVTYGLLNLTHRDNDEHPEPLAPGTPYRVRLRLNDFAHAFLAGHRIRVAISSSYWPLAWLPPCHTTLTVFTGPSFIDLPRRPATATEPEIGFPAAEAARPIAHTVVALPDYAWRVVRDLGRDESCVEVVKNRGVVRFDDIDWETETRATERYFLRHDDPDSISARADWTRTFRRGEWSVTTVTHTELTSTAVAFHIHARLDAYENRQRIYCRNWNRSIPRDLV